MRTGARVARLLCRPLRLDTLWRVAPARAYAVAIIGHDELPIPASLPPICILAVLRCIRCICPGLWRRDERLVWQRLFRDHARFQQPADMVKASMWRLIVSQRSVSLAAIHARLMDEFHPGSAEAQAGAVASHLRATAGAVVPCPRVLDVVLRRMFPTVSMCLPVAQALLCAEGDMLPLAEQMLAYLQDRFPAALMSWGKGLLRCGARWHTSTAGRILLQRYTGDGSDGGDDDLPFL